ncbi:TPA: hemagglutinin, partial [Neisseria meningitidis]
QGACKGLCYPHSSYFAEVPERGTEEWDDYVEKWDTPKEGADGKYINHAVPKLVVPNKPNGEKYEEKPF